MKVGGRGQRVGVGDQWMDDADPSCWEKNPCRCYAYLGTKSYRLERVVTRRTVRDRCQCEICTCNAYQFFPMFECACLGRQVGEDEGV